MAGLVVEREASLDRRFIGRVFNALPHRMKVPIDKVFGILDVRDERIYLDRTAHRNRQTFVTVHEVGHGFLPHQRATYDVMADGDFELDPDTKDLFEREANVFATEVLFQGEQFAAEAAGHELRVGVPVAMAKRYGTSVYAAMRRYVMTHREPCALLVFDLPMTGGDGASFMTLRRRAQSPAFSARFGSPAWPERQAPGGFFYLNLPGRASFGTAVASTMCDTNGRACPCTVESFNSAWQVFFLVRIECDRTSNFT